MELNQLRCFQAVAATENMTRAAEALHISQPTLSKVIARLEEDLGVPLFDRKASRLELNRYGHSFLAYSRQALDSLERGRQCLDNLRTSDRKRVRLATTFLGLSQMITERFALEHPEVAVSEVRISRQDALEVLRSGQADFVLSMAPLLHPEVDQTLCISEPLAMVMPAGRPSTGRMTARLADFERERFAIFEGGTDMRELFIGLCRQAGFVPAIAYECDSVTRGVGRLINAMDICAVFPIHPLLDRSRGSQDEPVRSVLLEDPGCHRDIWLSRLNKPQPSEFELLFMGMVMDIFKSMQSDIQAGLADYQL